MWLVSKFERAVKVGGDPLENKTLSKNLRCSSHLPTQAIEYMAAMLLMCDNVNTTLADSLLSLLARIIKILMASLRGRSGWLDNLLHSSHPNTWERFQLYHTAQPRPDRQSVSHD
jgi:hypothetical protein